jgi:hypothetical protein
VEFAVALLPYHHCDKIWRIYAYCVILKIAEVAHIFGLLFPHDKKYALFGQRMDGLPFGRFFHKLIWSPC